MTSVPNDMLPPHDDDAESCVLASMMLDRSMLRACRRILAKPDFFDTNNGIMFAVLCEMADADKPVDAVTLKDALASRGLLEELGGAIRIGVLLNTVPSWAHGESYAKSVKKHSDCRKVIADCRAAERRAWMRDDPEDIKRDLAKSISHGANCEGGSVLSMRELLFLTHDYLGERGDVSLKSSIPSLNNLLTGYHRGANHIIAALNSMGKSVLMVQELMSWALAGVPVLHFTLEETAQLIGTKLIASFGDVSADRLQQKALRKEDWDQVNATIKKLCATNYHVVRDVYDIAELEVQAASLIAEHGIVAVGVDHMHIMGGGEGRSQYEKASNISVRLKRLYHRHNVIGVTLAQLNRNPAVERRLPRKSDLRDTGNVEQDADTVILIHREDELHHGDATYSKNNEATIVIDKQKGGRTGHAVIGWDGEHQRFTETPPYSGPTFDDDYRKLKPGEQN